MISEDSYLIERNSPSENDNYGLQKDNDGIKLKSDLMLK